jgi:DNA polymerase-3 subunit delta'
VLERTLNDRGVLRTAISVEDARKTVTFFGATAAGGGWRVCIVDTVDELNANSANALLKVVEEPPPRSLFLLLSNAPARVLATIQSRCRKLMLRPLGTADVIRAAAAAMGGLPDNDAALHRAADASEGSVSRALMLLGGSALGLQERTAQLLKSLPNVDPRALHALGDALAGTDRTTLAAFIDTVERWLIERLGDGSNANLASLARVSEVWEKVLRDARDTQEYNLERKPLVFSVFGMLAEAMR